MVTAEAPVIETTRAEGSTRIDRRSVENLPNNGRNFLDYTKLTPGVTIVQGPDGDELSINGQKGIHNNVSVDGADFNNPFFGEQRGGQRPAFTFNLDAVQEVVVVADGAPAEFGRSSGGFVNVVTKSGTNETKGSVHAFYKDDSLSSAAKNPDGSRPTSSTQSSCRPASPSAARSRRTSSSTSSRSTPRRPDSTKQTDPGAHRAAGGGLLPLDRPARRERPDRAQQRRAGRPRQARLAGARRATWRRCASPTPTPSR